jgi:hypothetical protein
MSNQNTGGPAFPYEYFDGQLNKQRVMAGMTLRDYFAAKAMQAILSNPNCPGHIKELEIVEFAYLTADAMMKARTA